MKGTIDREPLFLSANRSRPHVRCAHACLRILDGQRELHLDRERSREHRGHCRRRCDPQRSCHRWSRVDRDESGALASALVVVVVAALVAYFFLQIATRLGSSMVVIDALSLALFCIAGADKALIAGLGIAPAILMGVVTATGGGIMRDILCDTEPVVLRPGTFSATAALSGSSVFVFMVTWLNFTKPFAMLISALVTLVLRVGSLWRGWKSKEPRDLTDVVATMPRRLLSGAGRLRRTTPCDSDDPDPDPDDKTLCQ